MKRKSFNWRPTTGQWPVECPWCESDQEKMCKYVFLQERSINLSFCTDFSFQTYNQLTFIEKKSGKFNINQQERSKLLYKIVERKKTSKESRFSSKKVLTKKENCLFSLEFFHSASLTQGSNRFGEVLSSVVSVTSWCLQWLMGFLFTMRVVSSRTTKVSKVSRMEYWNGVRGSIKTSGVSCTVQANFGINKRE